MTPSEKRPAPACWTKIPWPGPRPAGPASAWRSGPLMVLSELAEAEYPDGDGVGPQWLISITAKGKRAKPKQIRRALRAFGMVGAEEDNHHPGNARSFWRPLDPSRRVDCECKTDETIVVEDDGYTWTNPVDGPCRGCELAKLIAGAVGHDLSPLPTLSRSCPIHGIDAAPSGSTQR